MSERPEGDSIATGGPQAGSGANVNVAPSGMKPQQFLWDIPEVKDYLEARGAVPEADWTNLDSTGALAEQHPELAELRQKAEEAIHKTPSYTDHDPSKVLDQVVKSVGSNYSQKGPQVSS
jgi:hypothetical protein